jgi:hypothetical protein
MLRVLTIFLLNATLFAQDLDLANKVKNILINKCVSCHQQGGYSPVVLENTSDFKKREKFIQHVIENNIMPPWRADTLYRNFANTKSLSKSEKANILNWLKTGCPEWVEKSEDLKFTHGSQINRKPDLILKMKEPYIVPAINQNVYICYKIPFELKNDTFANAIEFIPGNKKVVHHASYQILEVENDVDIYSGENYFRFNEDSLNRVSDEHDYRHFNLIGKSGKYPKETYHGGWLPGTSTQEYPNSIGIRIPKKGVLLIRNFHYSPTPIEEKDLSGFNIFFTANKIKRSIGFTSFQPKKPGGTGEWIIKANDSSYQAHINVKFHQDISLLNINPHMHQLGKSFKAYALTPTGDTIRLINIQNWDFNWQEFYRFKNIIKIPAGSVLHADAIYNNSTSNPNNPYQPPRDIKFEWGMNDDSEMMRLVLLYLPYQQNDEKISLEKSNFK